MSSSEGSRSAARGVAAFSARIGCVVGWKVGTTVLLAAALAGCPAPATPSVLDAGRDTGGGAPDAGLDTGGGALDAPVDLDAPTTTDVGPSDDVATRGDAPILPPVDAGDPFGDAGALGTPEWVPLEVLTMGTCAPLTPCGGDVVGTWDVTGACVEVPLPDALFACPGATAVGSGMGRGRVTFTGTVAIRTAQSVVSVEVFVPTVCAGLIGGCAGLETMLQGAVADSACVTETTGCRCAARQHFEIDDGDAYTIVGNEIVSTTSGKHWAYCVSGGTLTYEDTSPAGATAPREEGIIELGMR